MKSLWFGITVLLSLPVWGADIQAGKAKSITCAACHGQKGIARVPTYPNLAGQKEHYLLQQLKAYKSGARKNPMMSSIVQSLSEQDMVNLAAYYANLSPCEK